MEICNRNIKIILLFLILIFLVFNVKAEIEVTKEKGIRISYFSPFLPAKQKFYYFCRGLEEKYKDKDIWCEDYLYSIVIGSVVDEETLHSIENDEDLQYYMQYYKQIDLIDLKKFTNFIRNVVNPILRDELIEEIIINLTEDYGIKNGKIEVANKEDLESGFDYLFKSKVRLRWGEISFNSSETKIEVYPEGQVKIEDVFIENINEEKNLTVVLKGDLLKRRVKEGKIKGKKGDKFVIKSLSFWSGEKYEFEVEIKEIGDGEYVEIKEDKFCTKKGFFKLEVYKRESLDEEYEKIQELYLSGKRCVNLLDGKISSLFLMGDKYYAENEIMFFEDKILYNIGMLLKDYALYPMEKGLIITEREVKSESGRVRIIKDKKEIKIT